MSAQGTLTDAEVTMLQQKLTTEHRVALAAIATLTAQQLYKVFMAMRNETPAVFARTVRKTMAQVISDYQPAAAKLSSAYYDNLRYTFKMSNRVFDVPRAQNSSYTSDPVAFMNTPAPTGTTLTQSPSLYVPASNPIAPPRITVPQQIADYAVDQEGYWIGRAVSGDFTPMNILAPTQQLVSSAIFDTSRVSISVNMDMDPIASDDGPQREARNNGGCAWCKLASYNIGGEELYYKTDGKKEIPEWRAGQKHGEEGNVFHKGCKCINRPAFRNEVSRRPEWVDKWEDDYYAARKQIMDENDALVEKRVEYTVERINSKGKLVTERKQKYEYYTADGKPAQKVAINQKNILSRVREATGTH